MEAGELCQLLVALLGNALMGRIHLALLHSSCRLCTGNDVDACREQRCMRCFAFACS